MRILVIGGTGFIGKHIVRRMVNAGHTIAVYHRGHTSVELPKEVREILDPLSRMPVETFPKELFEFKPEVVVHTIAMGAKDTHAAVEAFAGKVDRLVTLSSGDVYRAYGCFIGIEPGPVEDGLLTEDSPLCSDILDIAVSPAPVRMMAKSIHRRQILVTAGTVDLR